MYSLNRAEIIGNVTRDPEMRYTPAGQSVTSFGVATNRRWNDKDGNLQEATEFHDVVAWGKLAEIITQIIKKGNRIYIEGRLQTRQWEGQDGAKRQRTEIIAQNFIPLTPKSESVIAEKVEPEVPEPKEKTAPSSPKGKTGTKKETKKAAQEKKDDTEEIDLDDIPF